MKSIENGVRKHGREARALSEGRGTKVLARESFNLLGCGGLLDQLLDCGLVEQLSGQLVG